ncbi:hypothetical protein ACIBO5_02395 [Nonomuraea angiospora]|uniref:hypothetical protein n=1 Tax=Nonomuraea angiospora TaxID=46172 RepID=UPI0037878320
MLTQLIVLRGNSGSGKTSAARALRQAYGRRGLAVVGQDVLRRDILRELDVPERTEIRNSHESPRTPANHLVD